jgi:hypothetical protein
VVGAYSTSTGGILNLLPVNQILPKILQGIAGGQLSSGQGNRCPGSMERGGVWDPYPGMGANYCSKNEVPIGP